MALILPIPDGDKVNLTLPTFTLDVNQIPVRPPASRSPELWGLGCLEWNYFEPHTVELCITPETPWEIAKGAELESLGWSAYQRMQKTQFFKQRPSGTTLSLSEQESNELWMDMRHTLWPTVADAALTGQQRGDVSQIFFHAVSSGSTGLNSAYVTQDSNFVERADQLYKLYGVTVLTSNEAWNSYQPRYSLVTPTTSQIDDLWVRQQELLLRLRQASS